MEKINIAELLKACPKGMELDCTMFDNVTFYGISNERTIVAQRESVKRKLYLDKYGCPLEYPKEDLKCVIFPKGKTTWEGFVPLCKFKDGDILSNGICICLYNGNENDKYYGCYVAVGHIDYPNYFINQPQNSYFTKENSRLATEEEKQKLFKAIKDNGYKWNAETKTLEKLMEDKEINNFNVLTGLYKCVHRMFDGTPDGKLLFEVGNIYRCLSKHDRAEFEVSYGHSIYLEDPVVCKHFIPFEKQGEQKSNPCENCAHIMLNCHNFPCSKKKAFDQGKSALDLKSYWEEMVDNANNIEPNFKVGDKIRHKNDKTVITITGMKDDYYFIQFYNVRKHNYQNEKVSFKDQNEYELVPNKFDISTLKPFESRVLVRDRDKDAWRASFWGCLMKNRHGYNYDTTRGYSKQCIPYEGNEHLLGKTDDCDDFYKTW